VLNEKQYKEKLHRKAIYLREDENAFSEFLTDEKDFTPVDIFFLEEEKEKIRQEFFEYCEEKAKDFLYQDEDELYSEIYLEI
jgi:superfamily I DNA and/or RNA helicase